QSAAVSEIAGEGGGKLSSRADFELAVDAAEVHLDGLDGDEQCLSDVLVAHVVGGELRNLALACGERSEPCLHDFAWSCSGRCELVVRLSKEPERAEPVRDLDSFPEPLACLDPLFRSAERTTVLDECARVLELRSRRLEHGDGFL